MNNYAAVMISPASHDGLPPPHSPSISESEAIGDLYGNEPLAFCFLAYKKVSYKMKFLLFRMGAKEKGIEILVRQNRLHSKEYYQGYREML